ncbi:Uncharacterised protein family UPF0497 [Prunus dulcis]|uniref:Uncharacterized protein n=1 Tax=Prunus dulcis TaxID=3755 RepID=A0A4Y1RH72_PRUDU|nr:Uncharacterised protein family UPF0497 [Prunus dulcis]
MFIEAKIQQNPPQKTQMFSWNPDFHENFHNDFYIGCNLGDGHKQADRSDCCIEFDARYNYSPAFTFFAYANAVVSAFSLLSLFLAQSCQLLHLVPPRFDDAVLVACWMLCCDCYRVRGKYGNSHSVGLQSVITLENSVKEGPILWFSLTCLSFSCSCLPSARPPSPDRFWFRSSSSVLLAVAVEEEEVLFSLCCRS